jgi:WD40 repeat protein
MPAFARHWLACVCLAGAVPCPATGQQARTDRLGDPLPEGAVARLGTVRLRHSGPVTHVTFVPGGKWLLSGSAVRTVRLWELPSGREAHRFPGALLQSAHQCLSPDGKILVTHDRTLHFWDTTTGKELPWSPARQKRPDLFNVAWAAFSADGRLLGIAGLM